MNKKKYIILIMFIISLTVLMISYNKKEGIKLEEVALTNSNKINNENLAIMVQKEDGSGYEEVDTFPSGLALNTSLSGCIDKDGKEIDGAIEYNVETMSLKLKSKGSNYCYLYFLRDSEPPVITITIIDNYYTSAKMSITSNEESTYCVNKSSAKGDTSNCTLEGIINEKSSTTTKTFTNSGTYYIHVKDTTGNETISEAININVLYQKVEYIEGTGTQYINTNYKPNQNTRIILDFAYTDTDFKALFGSRHDYSSAVFGMWIDSAAVYPHYGNVGHNSSNALSFSTSNRNTIDVNKNVTTIGSYTKTVTSSTFSSNYTLYMFTMNTAGTIDNRISKGKLYGLKIFDNGLLIRDFIPAYRISDNVVGLYDTLNNDFYTNAGTGTFGKGNNIE